MTYVEGGETKYCLFNWEECGCFSFVMQTFANHECQCSDCVSGMWLFSLILLDINIADMDWFGPSSSGWVLPPKTASKLE